MDERERERVKRDGELEAAERAVFFRSGFRPEMRSFGNATPADDTDGGDTKCAP